MTVKNIEAGESEEGKEGENGKEEEGACPTEDSEAEEYDSEAGGRYFEGLQSNSEPGDFVDMRMSLIYECSHQADTAFRVRMFDALWCRWGEDLVQERRVFDESVPNVHLHSLRRICYVKIRVHIYCALDEWKFVGRIVFLKIAHKQARDRVWRRRRRRVMTFEGPV